MGSTSSVFLCRTGIGLDIHSPVCGKGRNGISIKAAVPRLEGPECKMKSHSIGTQSDLLIGST